MPKRTTDQIDQSKTNPTELDLNTSLSTPKWNGKLSEDNLDITATRSSGNGGQNVNKVSTKAQIRFDILNCDDLSLEERTAVLKYFSESKSSLLNSDNIAIITCQDTRSFNENRKRAIAKLENLINEALKPKKHVLKNQHLIRSTLVIFINSIVYSR